MPAAGENFVWSGTPELDAREVFFVRHAARIRDWAALERDVGAHVEELLVGLANDLARHHGLPDLDERGVVLTCNLDQGYPKIKLQRPSWPDGELSVAIGWRAGTVSCEGSTAPYVGVLTTGRWRDDASRRRDLLSRLASHQADVGASTSSWWVTFRGIPIPDGMVHHDRVDLAGYRDHLRNELRREWHAVADLLDAAVAEDER